MYTCLCVTCATRGVCLRARVCAYVCLCLCLCVHVCVCYFQASVRCTGDTTLGGDTCTVSCKEGCVFQHAMCMPLKVTMNTNIVELR